MYFYQSGTLDLKPIFTTPALDVQHPNPIILDAGGQAPGLIWFEPGAYDITVYNSEGVQVWEALQVEAPAEATLSRINTRSLVRQVDPDQNLETLICVPGEYANDGSLNRIYYYDSTSTAADDDDMILKPASVTGAGRWITFVDKETGGGNLKADGTNWPATGDISPVWFFLKHLGINNLTVPDASDDESFIQIGQRAFFGTDLTNNDLNLSYNAYREDGADPNKFKKVATGWAFRYHVDTTLGLSGFQYAPIGSPDEDFEFIWAWGVNRVGDVTFGTLDENDVELPDGNSKWQYEWLPNNCVRAILKTNGFTRGVFYGENCYPTGNLPVIFHVGNNEDNNNWSCTMAFTGGFQARYYGTDTPGTSFDTNSVPQSKTVYVHHTNTTVKASSFANAIAMGAIMDADFSNTDQNLIQNRIGKNSVLQSSKTEFLYDVWGSGFRTKLILGSTLSEAFSSSDVSYQNGDTISFTRDGYVVALGGTGSTGTGRMCRLNPDDSETEIVVDSDLNYFMQNSINSADESIIFVNH